MEDRIGAPRHVPTEDGRAERAATGHVGSNGVAYGRAPAKHNAYLTEVGPGTPCGEFMRRYWQPVSRSADCTSRPRVVTPLGEELILFRDGNGRPGLLYPRCMHRGTSLYYGKVDEAGIRCCYHGWQFDVEGHCLDQPCEPDGGLKKEAARQPWYPVQDRYGLVFAYMGPPEKMPVLPIIQELETSEGEYLHAMYDAGSPNSGRDTPTPLPWNWLQAWENIVDPYHVQVLHADFSGVQFHELFRTMPKVEFERVTNGVIYSAKRKTADGAVLDRVSHAFLPNMSSIPSPALTPGKVRGVQWWVPFGDHQNLMFNVQVTHSPERERRIVRLTPDGKEWDDMSEQEHQDHPADWEAQWAQGPISRHSDEHLAQSDVGVIALRRLLQQQIRVVQEGGDPVGVAFTSEDATLNLRSGNFFNPQ